MPTVKWHLKCLLFITHYVLTTVAFLDIPWAWEPHKTKENYLQARAKPSN